GGTQEAFYWMQGEHDGFLITNLPDGVAAAALAAAVGARGAVVSLQTHQIYDHDEQAAIMQRAKTAGMAYKPPTAWARSEAGASASDRASEGLLPGPPRRRSSPARREGPSPAGSIADRGIVGRGQRRRQSPPPTREIPPRRCPRRVRRSTMSRTL